MAYIYLSNGDYQGAKRVLEPQLDTVRAVGDQRLLVEALLKLGVVRDKSGDEQTAAELWHEAAEIALRAHYTFGYAEALSNLGGIAYGAHRDSEARDFWLKAIEAARQQDDRLLVGKLSLFLGIIAVRTEDLKEARIRFDQSRANFEKGGRDDLALNARSYLDHLDGLDG